MAMEAADVMTPQVITVAPDASIFQAIRLMLQNRISGLPVMDAKGRLVGIVTEGDFFRRAETGTERHRSSWLQFFMSSGDLADEYVHTHGRKVEDVMSRKLQTVSEQATLEEIVRTMERASVKRVPVLRGGKLVGIITRANLMRALASAARTYCALDRGRCSNPCEGTLGARKNTVQGDSRGERTRARRQRGAFWPARSLAPQSQERGALE